VVKKSSPRGEKNYTTPGGNPGQVVKKISGILIQLIIQKKLI
jgi:hypothetical protein